MPKQACHSTQHCVDHGFCHRCDPDVTDKALRILRTLREELDEQQTTEAYYAVAVILGGDEIERCIHDRTVHHRHHRTPVPRCLWCNGPGSVRQVPNGGLI